MSKLSRSRDLDIGNKKGDEDMYMNSLQRTRKHLLKEMDVYIKKLGDEDIWLQWIEEGVPDKATEEDYNFIAGDDLSWREICELFGNLIRIYDR